MDAGFKSICAEFHEQITFNKLPTKPLASLASFQHSNSDNSMNIVGTCPEVNTIKSVIMRQKQYLHFSRLDPSTQTEDVKSYISAKLNITPTDIECWPLVPKNKDVNTLQFISFKVGLFDDKLCEAMSSNIWPIGTTVRRFIAHDRPKNDMRRGLKLIPTTTKD